MATLSKSTPTKEASADSNPSQGEKRPLPSTQDVGEDWNSSGYDVEIPPANDTILARLRKIPRNPLPLGSSRIVEQPNPTHLTMATHLAVSSSAIPESQIPIFEAEAGGQTATFEAEVEVSFFGPYWTEIIGANLSTNPDVIMAETQTVIQPSGSREVDHGIIYDPSHTPDHQVVSSSLETTLVDPTTITDEVQILPDHTLDPLDPTDQSTDGQIFQTTSADQTTNASCELPAILVTDPPAVIRCSYTYSDISAT
ncbi:hypothetical protein Pyn_30518 [Prunus yedoensis var. nudiflora]|uniref:Uncharacterized protein n=1 Tax=Prunus yedoensis var. nudiflora TaxID=2094558 RepID=A0A314ZLG7_PRUYE|nr:hypothetical protein Pyn_30518 [Prunus yedoensis var. nudiflora]